MQETGKPAPLDLPWRRTPDDQSSSPLSGRRAGLVRARPWRRATRLLLTFGLALAVLGAGWAALPSPLDLAIDRVTEAQRFDLARWEFGALAAKARALVNSPAAGIAPDQGPALVRSYLDLAEQAGQLEAQISHLFSDPQQGAADAATQAQRERLAAIRAQLDQQAASREAVLEHQLSQQIEALGLTTGGVVWPPPRLRFVEPPHVLVVSPRDRIERLRSVDLLPDLDPADRQRMEETLRRDLDHAAYVTSIGGYGVYPPMVVDRHGLAWTAETIAHEWVHNYLAFRRLGWAYLEGGDGVTINETVASIVGEELGRALVAAYYPDLLPPLPEAASERPDVSVQPGEAEGFEFGPEMHATRLVVDELLKQGYVDEAEAFMEARRQRFVEEGYPLRVLNQAYFAFHGSYATGAASTDPIGPKLQELRRLSPSLRGFLHAVEDITSVPELDAALQRARQAAPLLDR